MAYSSTSSPLCFGADCGTWLAVSCTKVPGFMSPLPGPSSLALVAVVWGSNRACLGHGPVLSLMSFVYLSCFASCSVGVGCGGVHHCGGLSLTFTEVWMWRWSYMGGWGHVPTVALDSKEVCLHFGLGFWAWCLADGVHHVVGER